jgi:DNA replicative helicase MCM subunit Mcm2 (Cdc46/Mcm family)
LAVEVYLSGIIKDEQVNKTSAEYTKYILAHNVDLIDSNYIAYEFTDTEINRFNEVAKTKTFYEDMAQSIFPTIHGNETIKQSIFLQLVGGTHLYKDGSLNERGNINILLVGSPGCYSANTLVTLSNGTFIRGDKLYESKYSGKLRIGQIHSTDAHNGKIIEHHKFKSEPTKIIKTESKELTCNYRHPLLVKRSEKTNKFGKINITKEWIKAEDLKVGDKVRVIKKIDCTKHTYEDLGEYKFDESLGLFYGYLVADGTTRKYKISLCLSEDEMDGLRLIKKILKNKGIKYKVYPRKPKDSKIGNRIIKRTKTIYNLEINSKHLAELFSMEKQPIRKVPDIVLASRDCVIGSFLAGLFEGDGSVSLIKHKDKSDCPRIALKSSSHQLLLDVQTLLLRFGIQARIYSDNLTISKADDIETFYNEIGFITKRKSDRLKEYQKIIKSKFKRHKKRLYEEIKSIEDGPIQDVYDVTVDKYHRLITNGIMSHNTAKSQILKRAVSFLNNARFTSGNSSSGVGLVAAVVNNKEIGGWVVEAGALPMANKSLIAIDELDKATKEDIATLNNAIIDLKVSIDKASIHCIIDTDTTVLGAANPKDRVFDKLEPIWKQIDLPKDFLDRFDLIFPIDAHLLIE